MEKSGDRGRDHFSNSRNICCWLHHRKGLGLFGHGKEAPLPLCRQGKKRTRPDSHTVAVQPGSLAWYLRSSRHLHRTSRASDTRADAWAGWRNDWCYGREICGRYRNGRKRASWDGRRRGRWPLANSMRVGPSRLDQSVSARWGMALGVIERLSIVVFVPSASRRVWLPLARCRSMQGAQRSCRHPSPTHCPAETQSTPQRPSPPQRPH